MLISNCNTSIIEIYVNYDSTTYSNAYKAMGRSNGTQATPIIGLLWVLPFRVERIARWDCILKRKMNSTARSDCYPSLGARIMFNDWELVLGLGPDTLLSFRLLKPIEQENALVAACAKFLVLDPDASYFRGFLKEENWREQDFNRVLYIVEDACKYFQPSLDAWELIAPYLRMLPIEDSPDPSLRLTTRQILSGPILDKHWRYYGVPDPAPSVTEEYSNMYL